LAPGHIFNGASGPAQTLSVSDEASSALTTVLITLPPGITSSRNLVFTYGNGPSGAGSDDIAMDNVVVTSTRTSTTTFTHRYTDADRDSKTATVTLTINHVNDAPVNTVPVTIGPVDEDGTLAVSGISVADIDSAALTTTVTIANGTLNLGVTGGATVTGAGSGAIVS
jgi:hypothetical protein